MSTRARLKNEHEPARVLIVDDSSMTCWLLKKILDADPGIDVVGCAVNAHEARKMINKLKPDVITLDVEMPGMNGIDFLRNLMRLRPMPVVMVSTLTQHGAEITLEALSLGAIDFVPKPKGTLSANRLARYSRELIDKVLVASTAQINVHRSCAKVASDDQRKATNDKDIKAERRPARHVVAVGASTGGTEAIRVVLEGLPVTGPGVLVVQHITDEFNAAFVEKLNSHLPQHVCSAAEGQAVESGCVYVAPAGKHLAIKSVGKSFRCVLLDKEPVNFHRPSVDILFESVASEAGPNSTGIILTGMGKDGANGLAAIRRAGGHTVAQDEESSVVWGMPGAAVRLGAAIETSSLDAISDRITKRLASV